MRDEDYNSYSLRKYMEEEDAYGAQRELMQQGADEKPLGESAEQMAEEGIFFGVIHEDLPADFQYLLLTNKDAAVQILEDLIIARCQRFDGGKA